MIGFGCLGQGVIPLLFKHLGIKSSQLTIITADPIHNIDDINQQAIIQEFELKILVSPLTEQNYQKILKPLVNQNDFILNLSVAVSSAALIELAKKQKALYLDTCIEPWAGGYNYTAYDNIYECTNHAMRSKVVNTNSHQAHQAHQTTNNNPTAILCQGANPGLISQFVKQALLNIAQDNNLNMQPASQPTSQQDWALLAQKLNIKTIHIAERDTQTTNLQQKKSNNYNKFFYNTWSVDGFLSEGTQPAELSFGTHENHFPSDGNHCAGDKNIIYLNRPGLSTKVRTWTPSYGAFHGYLITHNEIISLSKFLRITENNQTVYCPTIHYSYRPCDDAIYSIQQLQYNEYKPQEKTKVLQAEIIDGYDELGVLLMGNQKGAYWYGSRLSIQEARQLCKFNSATSLQVVAGVIAGMIWAIENPNRGIIEPEQLDHDRIMEIASPYLGKLFGEYTTWTPLVNRDSMFPEDLDWDDPWQFKNIQV